MNLPNGQVRQVDAYASIVDALALVTVERDLEEGFHVVVWESYDWWGTGNNTQNLFGSLAFVDQDSSIVITGLVHYHLVFIPKPYNLMVNETRSVTDNA